MNVSELKKMQFVLSPFYELPKAEDVIDFDQVVEDEKEEIDLLKEGELFLLTNEKGSYFLINPVIHAFLKAFDTAKKIDDVTTDFAQKSNCEPAQIEDVMMKFLNQMGKRGVIIDAKYEEKAKTFLIEKPMYKQWFEIGDNIGSCEVIDVLSIREGTQLYTCKHPQQTEYVVVKTMMFPEEMTEKKRIRSLRKFRQEFQFMEELGKHPNICHLIELNTEGEYPYAVIEKIDGQSLRGFAKKEGASIEIKLSIIHQLLSAITYVQNHQIVHGDLHLSNFLVTAQNEVKLIDFGLSNHEELQEDEIIRNGGVHECVPPERVKVKGFSTFKKRGDFRSEVFQLGVLIYFILYQKYPFKGFTWAKLAQSIQEDILEYPDLTADGQDVPKTLQQLLTIAMQKAPEDRFENAAAMVAFFEKKIT